MLNDEIVKSLHINEYLKTRNILLTEYRIVSTISKATAISKCIGIYVELKVYTYITLVYR